jgi:hypothetical protein
MLFKPTSMEHPCRWFAAAPGRAGRRHVPSPTTGTLSWPRPRLRFSVLGSLLIPFGPSSPLAPIHGPGPNRPRVNRSPAADQAGPFTRGRR